MTGFACAANTAAGDNVWMVDANRNVYISEWGINRCKLKCCLALSDFA